MEALGLIDAIITTINDSPKKAFSNDKVIIDKKQIKNMLEKLKMVISRGGDVVREAISGGANDEQPVVMEQKKLIGESSPELFGVEGEALLLQAKEEAGKIRDGADKYADNVLANLMVIVSKMERTIENGRERLGQYKKS